MSRPAAPANPLNAPTRANKNGKPPKTKLILSAPGQAKTPSTRLIDILLEWRKASHLLKRLADGKKVEIKEIYAMIHSPTVTEAVIYLRSNLNANQRAPLRIAMALGEIEYIPEAAEPPRQNESVSLVRDNQQPTAEPLVPGSEVLIPGATDIIQATTPRDNPLHARPTIVGDELVYPDGTRVKIEPEPGFDPEQINL